MNLFGLSPGEILLIAMVAMIVLGPERLPEVAASVGKWIREFRRATEELTSQFADENPFAEIQKALALDELMAPTVITTAPPAQPVASPMVETAGESLAPVVPLATVPERVKSYHFFGPPNHPGLDPEWTYGVPVRAEIAPSFEPRATSDDHWLHGVPVLPEAHPPTGDEEILNQILATAPDVDGAHTGPVASEGNSVPETAVDAESVVAESNGHQSDAFRDPAAVELTPAATLEETHPEPAFVGGEGKSRSNEEHQP